MKDDICLDCILKSQNTNPGYVGSCETEKL